MLKIREAFKTQKTVIINDVDDYLPPELEELLLKVDKSKNHIYLRTKVPNPQFNPEVSTSVNIINFLVNDTGLEEQLLAVIVRNERAEAEA